YHTAPIPEPRRKIEEARSLAAFFAESVPAENNPWGLFLRQELGLLTGMSDSLLSREHLEAENRPCFFAEFVDRAARHGLSYLGEADFASMVLGNFPPRIAETLSRISPDVIRQEQLMDFLRNRAFRQTLLVHAQNPIDRNIVVDRLRGLFLACPCTHARQSADGSVEFRHASGVALVARHEPTKEVFQRLGEAFPAFLPVDSLLADPTVGADLLRVFASGMAELRADAPPILLELPEYPCVWKPARLAAERSPTPGLGALVPTLRHEMVRLDELGRWVAILADGSQTRPEIEEGLMGLVSEGKLAIWDRDRKISDSTSVRHYLGVGLAQALEAIRRHALLSGPDGPGG
ncbi:MAG: methyltransferase regulatory domain-containing protein, partial [Methylacidiphilaceae bacterium]|nr:methyltransferase regulatory domain-containing protein [Candidatus Methylacidiphilaceae bacterium]